MERSRDWFAQAQRDLGHAKAVLTAGYYEWACFSSQQAAEKALKAVFQHLGASVWGHSVADLLSELGQQRDVAQSLQDAALELDKAYIPTRYPDAHPSGFPGERYTKGEATRLVAHAEAILEFCADFLS